MKTRNKILALAISSVLSQAAFAEAGDQAPCNSTDALTGWGIWCTEGVKPATAAGPAPSITVAQNIPADIGGSDDFGGKTEDNGLPIVVGDERVYYRAAYDSATTYSYGYKWVYENGQYTYPEEDNFNAEGGTASAKGIGTAELNPTDANPGGDLQSGYLILFIALTIMKMTVFRDHLPTVTATKLLLLIILMPKVAMKNKLE